MKTASAETTAPAAPAPAALPTHNLSVYVANRPGALARIAQTFSRRGFNIESLVVSPGKTAELSRMTITVKGEEAGLEQVIQQCSKLDVVACREHGDSEVVSRELALVKIRATAASRGEILQIADYFRAKTVDMAEHAMVLEITGTPDKIDAMIALLRKFGIEELIRTGKVIVARGDRET